MPITIGPGQLISPEASSNYFQMIAAARRAEAERKQREQQMFMQAIAQGVENFTTPLREAARDRRIEEREDKRFNRQLEAQREARNQSAATQMDMTPTEYAQFAKTNTMPPTVAARAQAIQRQRVQQQIQVEQIKRQQEAEAKAKEESLANLDDQYNNGRLPQDLNVRYSALLAQEAAVYGDGEYLAGRRDPEQFAADVSRIQREKEAIARQVKPPKSDADQFAETVVTENSSPAIKALVANGTLPAGMAWIGQYRNGHRQFVQVPGTLTEKEKLDIELQKLKLQNERAAQAAGGVKGDKAKDPVDEQAKRFDQAIKYLEAIYGERQLGEKWSPEQIDEGLTAVARSPEENDIKVMEDRARRRAGARRPQVEALIQQTRLARENGNAITEPEIILAQMQALIAENPGKSPQVRALLQEYRDMLALFEEEGAE